jgi:WD40 repeat protein
MKPIIYSENKDLIVAYKNDLIKSITDQYDIRLKSNLYQTGVRCLYYYEKENTLIITHLYGKKVHLINLTTGKLRYYLHHMKTVRHVYVHENEIITASWDGTIRVVDFYTLEERLALTDTGMGRSPQSVTARLAQEDYVFGVSYDSDLNPLCRTNSIRKWSLKTGEIAGVFSQTGEHLSTLSSAECVVHQGLLYVISDSGFLTVFNAENSEWIKSDFIPRCLRSLLVVPEFNCILVTDQDGYVHTFDLQRLEFVHTTRCHRLDVTSICQSSTHPEIIASSSFDGDVKLMKMPKLEEIACLSTDQSLWSTIILNDLIITGGDENEIWLYNIENPNNCVLLGKLFVLESSYALCKAESKLFFTDDISNFEVIDIETKTAIEGKNADHLLDTCNTEAVIYEIFGIPEGPKQLFKDANPFPFQLPESSSYQPPKI